MNLLAASLRRPAPWAVAFTAVVLSACAAAPLETGYLTIESSRYHEAFHAAGEVARSYGLAPALRDRRAGVIETEPAVAGSLLEPWDRATLSFEQAAASTVSFQRRRARFEFQPHPTPTTVAGFERTAAADADLDLTDPQTLARDLELRVWVYNERAHAPGIRRSDWSRRLTTRAEVVDPDTGRPLRPVWTVVARDRALEQRLLAEVNRVLAR